ncbi:hypothetical protein TNCV_586781 [Trichonephila clavipes]|nr:hypothetical protein TNCV_586781 [Trichonephila clavipes]
MRVDHPSYISDLAPKDFHLFGPLKKHLKSQHFRTDAEFQKDVLTWLHNLDTNFYDAGFDGLVRDTPIRLTVDQPPLLELDLTSLTRVIPTNAVLCLLRSGDWGGLRNWFGTCQNIHGFPMTSEEMIGFNVSLENISHAIKRGIIALYPANFAPGYQCFCRKTVFSHSLVNIIDQKTGSIVGVICNDVGAIQGCDLGAG